MTVLETAVHVKIPIDDAEPLLEDVGCLDFEPSH